MVGLYTICDIRQNNYSETGTLVVTMCVFNTIEWLQASSIRPPAINTATIILYTQRTLNVVCKIDGVPLWSGCYFRESTVKRKCRLLTCNTTQAQSDNENECFFPFLTSSFSNLNLYLVSSKSGWTTTFTTTLEYWERWKKKQRRQHAHTHTAKE